MKNLKILTAVLGGFLGATMMMVVLGLFNAGSFTAGPPNHSLFLPHLLMVSAVGHPGMGDPGLAAVPGLLRLAHAALVLFAILVAGTLQTRAAQNEWVQWLTVGLGGTAYYVAHFCFLHPGNPAQSVTLGVRVLDHLALAALALGVWGLVQFAFHFPGKFDAAAFDAFVNRRLTQANAKGASSRYALWRWLHRQGGERQIAQAAKVRRWQTAFCQSPWLPVVLTLLGWVVLWESQLLSGRREAGFFVRIVTLYVGLMAGVIPLGLASSVLDWHRHEGDVAARRAATLIWRSGAVALWLSLALLLAALLRLFLVKEGLSLGLFLVTFPAGVLLVSFTFLATVGLATWSAPRAAVPAAN
ncbi:MAG TPA: hypothetical protein VHE13_11745 [Opitutus sp.]|nr:hypothetical protein [Opitutus sp.]